MAYGNMLDWLMNEYRRIINGFKDIMPSKAKIIDEPHFIWIQATRHVNYPDDEARKKFNKCLRLLTEIQENTAVYFLQQLWEQKNNNLVLPHNGRLTFNGVCTIWDSIDRTIKYGVTRYQATLEKIKYTRYANQRASTKKHRHHRDEREDRDEDSEPRRTDYGRKFKLPPPPRN